MNEDVLKALYMINKYAKKCRDQRKEINNLRELIKEQLFSTEPNKDYDLELEKMLKENQYNDCEEILKKHNITQLGYVLDEECGKCVYNQNHADVEYKDSIEGLDWVMRELIDCPEMSEISLDMSVEELDSIVSDESIRERIAEYIKDAKIIKNNYEKAIESFDNLHYLLGDNEIKDHMNKLNNQKNALYSLKDAVLIKSGVDIKEYHIDKNNSDYALAFYEIGDYSFHRIVEWTDEIREIVKDTEIDIISAEIKKDVKMSEEEAIRIVIEYIDCTTIGDTMSVVKDILNGEIDNDELRDKLELPEMYRHCYIYDRYEEMDEYEYNYM